jgi:hypothetical protein
MSPSRVTGNLHPYVRPLTVSDLGSCEALEKAAFKNEEERATREKVFLCSLSFCSIPMYYVWKSSRGLLMGGRMNNR